MSIAESATAGRYKLTVQRGDLTETFDDLSSDKKDKAARYVENVVNDPTKGSKLVRVSDASGGRESAETRAPKAGSYSFSGDGKAAGELPPPAVRLTSRVAESVPGK